MSEISSIAVDKEVVNQFRIYLLQKGLQMRGNIELILLFVIEHDLMREIEEKHGHAERKRR